MSLKLLTNLRFKFFLKIYAGSGYRRLMTVDDDNNNKNKRQASVF